MGLFNSKPADAAAASAPAPAPTGGPAKKAAPTPSRKAAEAARRERLNPTLSPKEAKLRQRAAEAANRQRAMAGYEASPQRQLVRDVVDSRWNLGEVALPILLLVMAMTFIPQFLPYVGWGVYFTWAFMATLALDTWFMWRTVKKLAAERLPGVPLKGLLMYGFNRQMQMRRWRQPPARLKRGETF